MSIMGLAVCYVAMLSYKNSSDSVGPRVTNSSMKEVWTEAGVTLM